MKRFRNILCVTSATQGDTAVVERAVALAEHNQARLTLLGVVPRVTAGIGIPEGRRADLFNAFTQLDASNTRSHGGSGLGLAIVRQLADANGLQVRLEPRPGGGTLARVRLGTSD